MISGSCDGDVDAGFLVGFFFCSEAPEWAWCFGFVVVPGDDSPVIRGFIRECAKIVDVVGLV